MSLSEFDEAYEDDHSARNEAERRVGEAILSESIRELEPRPAITLALDASVGEAIRLMREERIGAVLVTRDGRPVGIFTERDVLRKVVFSSLTPETPISQVMTADPECLEIDDGIAFALNRMILGGFRHVPLVDGDGRAVGALSLREVVAFIVSLLPGRVLNLPPEPRLQAHSEDGG